jgi:molybdate transport system substrate-binding protein
MLAYIIWGNDMTRTVGALVTLAICLTAQAVAGAEIKVYSTIGVKSALEDLAPKFQKETGNKLNITWGLISAFTKKAQEGDVPDVLVVSRASIDSLTKDGKIAAGSDATLAKSVFAIAVKRGAPKPDISSAEALKSALLAARAVAYSDPAAGGASGVHFAKVVERLGIASEIKAKSKFPPPAGFAGTLLISGEADIAVQSKPELSSTEGVEIVGPLPGDLGSTTVYAAGVGASSPNSETGKTLVRFLISPEAQAAFTKHGFDLP